MSDKDIRNSLIESYWQCVIDNQELFESEFLVDNEHQKVRVNDVYWGYSSMLVDWVLFNSRSRLLNQQSRFSILLWDNFYNERKKQTKEVIL